MEPSTTGIETMNPLYEKALNGTLKNPVGASKITKNVSITNAMPMAVSMFSPYEATELQTPWGGGETSLSPHGKTEFPPGMIPDGTNIVLRCSGSGGLVAVIVLSEAAPVQTIGHSLLTIPNDIGSFPLASELSPIPADSGRVIVGCGKVGTEGATIAREQYWRRLSQSYSVGPGETRTINFTHTSGMSRTSSDTNTTAASVGTSISAGWGPISASISGSLNKSSTTFQEVAFHEETTRYESFTATNTTDKIHTYMYWQLTDIITVFSANEVALSSILSGQDPVLITGPTPISNMLTGQ